MSEVEQTGGAERVGNHERESAISALQQHAAAGRLTSTEYEDRSVSAREARTWADLEALFTDLPAPGAAEIRARHVDELRPAVATGHQPVEPVEPFRPAAGRSGWVPEPYGTTITALAPIAAVILFFWTGSWLWFLAIPAIAIIVHGPDGDPKKRRRRRC
jgi:uncharacterized protein DUF1707